MDKIDKFRKIYISCPKPESLEQRWNQIEAKLGSQNSARTFRPSYLITAVIGTLFLSATLVGGAQATKPGDQLYPLKILTDNTIAVITNKPEYKIKKRAEDIINVSNDSKKLDTAVQHYQQAVENVGEKVQKPQDRQKFNKTLQDQEVKFQKKAKDNPPLLKKLPEIIKENQKVKKDIKGIKTNKPAKNNQGNKENKESKGRSKK